MADRPIIPTADAVISPVLEKLYKLRPKSFNFLNLRNGVYWHPVLGYRAQAAQMLRRLALLAGERRLKTATGKALLDYVASEFDAVPETDKTVAEGELTIGRLVPSPLPGGDYPKGTRLTRTAFTQSGIDYPTAEFETLADVHIDFNSLANVVVPVRAIRAGAHANAPIVVGGTNYGITIPSLVGNMGVVDFQVAGGSEGPDDNFVRAFARAYSLGQYGPTIAASRLGALSGTGVRHFLCYDTPATGSQRILVADASWASSDRWARKVQQAIYDADLVGFGCKIGLGTIRNKAVSVAATVALRDSNYLVETTEIDIAIQKAVRSYFDDRLDWNQWSKPALRSAITRAHPKIFSCSLATVLDAGDGSSISEVIVPDYTIEQFHFYLANNAMKLTYVGPS